MKIQKALLELENEEIFNFGNLKEKINDNYKPIKSVKSLPFKGYSQQLIEAMLSINKADNTIIYQTATNQLMGYANTPKLRFTDSTYKFLERFKNDLIKPGLKANSISN